MSELVYLELGQFLQERRVKKGLTQKEVAEALGYTSAQYISNFERGTCPPPFDLIPALAELYGLKEEEITKVYLDCIKRKLNSRFVQHRSQKKKVRLK